MVQGEGARALDPSGSRQPVIVVDASVMVEIVLRTETGNRLWTQLRHRSEPLHAPHVIDLEVANALLRCLARGEVDDRGGDTALVNLEYVQIERHPHGCGSFS